MDLNHLYSEHQLALMRAAGATSRLARVRHLGIADMIGNRIGWYQLSIGAPASSGWFGTRNPMRGSDAGRPQ
jgi:hypothetical protein